MNAKVWATLAVLVFLLGGCDYLGEEEYPVPEDSQGQPEEYGTVVVASFTPYAPDAEAVTYNSELVPEGSEITFSAVPDKQGTGFGLEVKGLLPDRDYGAHVHTHPCGPAPEDAGPHYQNKPDPSGPASNDPEYANARNEVWLDLTTDADGKGEAHHNVAWDPRADDFRSLVLHTEHTRTAPGEAGEAGERLACLNIDLEYRSNE